ncbi:MAG: PqqD family protein [Candidatus Omnitrophota bacterium]
MNNEIMEKIFKKSDSVVFRKIADEYVLVPLHQEAIDLEALFSFNETAARIWDLIDGKRNGSDIAEVISREFKQPKEGIEKDVIEFFIKLKELNFIVDVK